MRALVAGAAGFLGSHLCDRLRRDGTEVVGLDNFCTGRRENVKHLEEDPGFSFFEHDITRPTGAAVAGPLDVIFNLACPASPRAYQRDPLFTLDTNYVGTQEPPRIGAREWGDRSAGFHQRDLRGSDDPSPGRELLGQRQLLRRARLLPRGQASCGDTDARVRAPLRRPY